MDKPARKDFGESPADQVQSKIKSVARKIANSAMRLQGKAELGVDWSTHSNGTIYLAKEIPVTELTGKYPFLAMMIAAPDTDTNAGISEINEKSVVAAIGFWRNPDTDYSAVQMLVETGDEEGVLMLETSIFPERAWRKGNTKIHLGTYTGSKTDGFIRALDGFGEFASDVISSGNIRNADFYDNLFGKIK